MCHRYLLNIFWMKFDFSQDVAMEEPKKASFIFLYEIIAFNLQRNKNVNNRLIIINPQPGSGVFLISEP